MPHAYVIFVSTKTGDAEGLKLRNTGPLEYSTEGELKILIGLNKAKNDGVLTVGAGEVITAYYYNTSLKESNPQMKNKPQQPDIVSEFAFIEKKTKKIICRNSSWENNMHYSRMRRP